MKNENLANTVLQHDIEINKMLKALANMNFINDENQKLIRVMSKFILDHEDLINKILFDKNAKIIKTN